ncbi:MAG: hypothetical protein AAF288_07780 [Planctomycetota bacterium]
MRIPTALCATAALSCAFASTLLASELTLLTEKLIDPDGAPFDQFGEEVAVSGDYLLVGSPFDGVLGRQSGSASLFDRTTGQKLFTLTAPDGREGDRFGVSLAIDGDTIIIGAPEKKGLGGEETGGAIYFFDAVTGAHQRTITAPGGTPEDNFGVDIAIDDGLAVVGAFRENGPDTDTGAAYLFDVSSGTQLRRFEAESPRANDRYGLSVDIDDRRVLVGSPNEAVGADGVAGATYVYDALSGAQIARLTVSDGVFDFDNTEDFGFSVAIDGDTALIGEGSVNSASGTTNSGAAHLFDLSSYTLIASIDGPSGLQNEFFGRFVALDDGIAAVSAAEGRDQPEGAGVVYLYDASTGTLLQQLEAFDAARDDGFGVGLALDDGELFVGAFTDGFDVNGTFRSQQGSVYRYVVPEPATGVVLALGGVAACRRRR